MIRKYRDVFVFITNFKSFERYFQFIHAFDTYNVSQTCKDIKYNNNKILLLTVVWTYIREYKTTHYYIN